MVTIGGFIALRGDAWMDRGAPAHPRRGFPTYGGSPAATSSRATRGPGTRPGRRYLRYRLARGGAEFWASGWTPRASGSSADRRPRGCTIDAHRSSPHLPAGRSTRAGRSAGALPGIGGIRACGNRLGDVRPTLRAGRRRDARRWRWYAGAASAHVCAAAFDYAAGVIAEGGEQAASVRGVRIETATPPFHRPVPASAVDCSARHFSSADPCRNRDAAAPGRRKDSCPTSNDQASPPRRRPAPRRPPLTRSTAQLAELQEAHRVSTPSCAPRPRPRTSAAAPGGDVQARKVRHRSFAEPGAGEGQP